MSARRVRRLIVAALAGLVGALALASPASAHATLLSTDPADGALLEQAPAEVTSTFDEPVEVRSGAVRLLDAAGTEVSSQARSVDTRVVLTVPPDVADGTYIVTWRVISADSHPVAGGFSFSIGTPSAGVVAVPVRRTDHRATTAAPGRRGGGLPRHPGRGWPDRVPARTRVTARRDVLRRRLWQTARCGRRTRWRRTHRADPGRGRIPGRSRPIRPVRGPDVERGPRIRHRPQRGPGHGRPASPSAHRHRARPPSHTPPSTAVGFGATALALGALALVGHTRTFGPGWLVPAVDMLHVTAAAVWLGGIIALVLTLSRHPQVTATTRRPRPSPASRRSPPRSCSSWPPPAPYSAGASSTRGPRWSPPRYGYALLTKIGLALAVVAVAAYNRFSLVPAISREPEGAAEGRAWRRLRTTVRAEALVLVAIVAATGVLVTQSPVEGRTAGNAGVSQGTDHTSGPRSGTGTATIRLTPGTVGVNSLELIIADATGQPVIPVAPPELTVTLPAMDVGPLDRALSQTGPGRYEAIADFPLAGTWTLRLSVRTTTYDYPVAEFTVEIR